MDNKKKRALEGIINGESITSIAKEIGCSRTTIYNWMNNDPEFIKTKEELETRLLDELYNISLMETKEELISSNNPYFKLQVLQSLLKIKHSEKLEVTNKVMSLDDLLQDL